MSDMGLLSMLADNDFMARLAEKERIAERVAEQMGVTLQEAHQALYHFAADLSSDGQTLH